MLNGDTRRQLYHTNWSGRYFELTLELCKHCLSLEPKPKPNVRSDRDLKTMQISDTLVWVTIQSHITHGATAALSLWIPTTSWPKGFGQSLGI